MFRRINTQFIQLVRDETIFGLFEYISLTEMEIR